MSKFDLRDIAERLTRSSGTEAVIYEFLGYLQSIRPDWRASLAFYEVSSDALVSLYRRSGRQLEKADLTLAVDLLPPRLVRKFFHPSAFFNHSGNRSIFSNLLHGSPFYEPDRNDSMALRPLVPVANWLSCVCVPLADREDVIALLTIASESKGAFEGKVLSEIIPVKSLAAMALAQNLYRDARSRTGIADDRNARIAAAEFQERLRKLNENAQELERENRAKSEELSKLVHEMEQLDKNSSHYRQELERVKGVLMTLEEQTSLATHHLHDAYSELSLTQTRLSELEQTVEFLREVFQLLAEAHDPDVFGNTIVAWFAQHFRAERCSLMVPEHGDEVLMIAAQCGIQEDLASKVRVRVGQGISGWVARNRKPLFVRMKDEIPAKSEREPDTYNSDSFISVPLVFNNRLCGVMNLSNKQGGYPFEHAEMERAMLVASVIAVSLGGFDAARRAAWAA